MSNVVHVQVVLYIYYINSTINTPSATFSKSHKRVLLLQVLLAALIGPKHRNRSDEVYVYLYIYILVKPNRTKTHTPPLLYSPRHYRMNSNFQLCSHSCALSTLILCIDVEKGPLDLLCGASSRCERGHYCVNGFMLPCPAGRFGSSSEETGRLCSGPCPEGFFCPGGTSRLAHRGSATCTRVYLVSSGVSAGPRNEINEIDVHP